MDSEIKNHVEFTPDLAGGRDDYDPWATRHSYSRLRSPHRRDRTYDIRLPEKLKAWHEYRVVSKVLAPKDEFGRTLLDPIDMRFFTDHRRL